MIPKTIDDSATDAAVAELPMMLLPNEEICRLDSLYNAQASVRQKLSAQYEAEANGQKLAANSSAPNMTASGDNMMMAPTMAEGGMKAPASANAAPTMGGGMMAPPSTADGGMPLTPSLGTAAAMSPELLQELAAAPHATGEVGSVGVQQHGAAAEGSAGAEQGIAPARHALHAQSAGSANPAGQARARG